MSHYQVLASPSHLQGPYLSMKTSGNHLWWHLWAKRWPCFIGEKFPKIESNFKVVLLERNFAFFGLKPNDIKQRSWFWPKIQISQRLSQLDWRHLHCKFFDCKNCRFPLCSHSHCTFTAVFAVHQDMWWTTALWEVQFLHCIFYYFSSVILTTFLPCNIYYFPLQF